VQLIRETPSAYERGGTQKDEYSPDEVVSVPCPLCGSSEGAQLYTEHRSIGIKQCASCSLIYTSPRIRDPEHVYWGEYEKYLTEARLILDGRATHHRDPNYLEELELIERWKPARGSRFLDVGCNMGMLLRLARERGWTTVGVEPSPALHRIATEHLGLEVYNCLLDEMPAAEHGAFDVVALSDVFEHVTEPREFLRAAAKLMKPDGVLYLKVPNALWNLLKQRLLGRLGRAPGKGVWDSYEHVVHYTDDTLRKMLAAEGFTPLELTFARPIQVPVWHEYVGQYYQYPSPWVLDWRRHLGRLGFYYASALERRLRGGAIGYCAPNLVGVAQRTSA
jgi:SAM-dependent methyltransferase